ncbi:hypothetical protein MHH33_08960 [Paenisporosarcina sp. FSL H8-0542]|uniref:hypothetical protein n=1 Tax=Paenisporosarcina sp. FSL H8-0542 TaxID=2921401 RepID=UPI00315B2A9E
MEKDTQIEIFNMFHDGTLIGILNKSGNIELKIEIPYLAEMINEKFNYFYCELVNCKGIMLETWSDEKEDTSDINTIIEYELEILDAQASKEGILVGCRSEKIIGGNLHINSQNIKIYDESKKEISLDDLTRTFHWYWNKL